MANPLLFSVRASILIFASDNGATKYGINFAVLGGEVAVPCTRNPLQRG